jgi:predicted secreted protein
LPLYFFFTACAAPATEAPAPSSMPAIIDPSQPITVKAGENFRIVVESNPSTGYEWKVIGEFAGVEFDSTEYTAGEPVLPGSGGVDVWTFKAVSTGETQITLGAYPAGSTEYEQIVTFSIIIE